MFEGGGAFCTPLAVEKKTSRLSKWQFLGLTILTSMFRYKSVEVIRKTLPITLKPKILNTTNLPLESPKLQ